MKRNGWVTQSIATDDVADVLGFAVGLSPKITPVGRGIKQALDGNLGTYCPRTWTDIVDFATGNA